MKTNYLILFAIGTMFFVGCKKEGCTDETATNYNSDAGKDDESCLYDGSLHVWLSQATADTLTAAYPLDVWMGGASQGSIEEGTELSSEPSNCTAEAGTVLYTKNFQYDASTASITVYDANNIEVFRVNSATITKNTCTKVKI
jgi:hypothetical protein